MSDLIHYEPPFYVRHAYVLKHCAAIAVMAAFYGAYAYLPFVGSVVDRVVDPAVTGITVLYGGFSQLVNKSTGLDLGFLKPEDDSVFEHRVEFARFINDRNGAALVQLATDQGESKENREKALRALLKFDTSQNWIQPFLNELPRGGLPGLYDQKAPVLDELFEKIRQEGGIQNSLVRAYAEVVFSFMLQVPGTPVVRIHALRWLNDALAEDALFLILPRLELEEDPNVRNHIVQALSKIRAISKPEKARGLVFPLYRHPPWPEVRLPLAMIMARLGYNPATAVLKKELQREDLTDLQRVDIRVAMSGKRYPSELEMTEREKVLQAKRERARRRQQEEARKKLILARQDEIEKAGAEKTNAPEKELNTEDLLAYLDKTNPSAPSKARSQRKPRETKTAFFEAVVDNAPVFKEPSESSQPFETLHMGETYPSSKSKQVDGRQWFYIKKGWVRGTDIQLANSPDKN